MTTSTSLALRGTPSSAVPVRTLTQLWQAALGRDGVQLQVALEPWRAWSFDVRREPMQIALLEGEVMVTFQGDPNDHILSRGAVFTTPRRGRVAVLAFQPSRFSVAAVSCDGRRKERAAAGGSARND